MPDQEDIVSRWDIFCRVIDNFGDAGVCWRLAADLAARGESVRLYIDQPDILTALIGNDPASLAINVEPWPDAAQNFTATDIADVVIEAFACDPPDAYIRAMNATSAPVVWINLEYLSAEDWVVNHHGLASPHPRYALTKHFYFPGFVPGTGGLLREPGLIDRLDAPGTYKAKVDDAPFKVFLFGYDQPLIADWMDAVAKSHPTDLSVAPCPTLTQITQWQQLHVTATNPAVYTVPFVNQHAFDYLINDFDWLFVRGEDSFVRAQWAAKPLVWQIYPQEDGVHLVKLKAFYDRYLDQGVLTDLERSTFWRFVLGWNADTSEAPDVSPAELWPELLSIYPALLENARVWRNKLLHQADLVTQLRDFVGHLVKSSVSRVGL